MAHLHLLSPLSRLTLLLASVFLASSSAAASSKTLQEERQEQINQALRSVLRLIDSGDSFLTYDREAGELRLHQDRALLRTCPAARDDLGEVDFAEDRLTLHIRDYRLSHAYAPVLSSPFDWEQYLVADANESCALYFATGLLIHASSERGHPRPPSLRIEEPADLRALYNTFPEGAALVILPPGWDSLPSGPWPANHEP